MTDRDGKSALSGGSLMPGTETGLTLIRDGGVLCLTDGKMTLRGDFSLMLRRTAPGRLGSEALIRAARLKDPLPGGPFAVDATAGLGEDSFLLAAAGFRVLMFEKDPVIAALLSDALERASADPGTADIASRMEMIAGDSAEGMRSLPSRPDVILLDPMFPARKKSGLTGKKMQLLGRLEAPAGEAEGRGLLEAAKAASPQKIIIKRPEKGEFLGGIRPSYSIFGNTVRFDCIVNPV